MTDWNTADLRLFRFSKFKINKLFDGNLHLLRRDVDFPGVMADADISQRLRSAAHYRRIRIALTFIPDGIYVQAHREAEELEGSLAEQLFSALEVIELLERKYEQRLAALEEEVSLLKSQRP